MNIKKSASAIILISSLILTSCWKWWTNISNNQWSPWLFSKKISNKEDLAWIIIDAIKTKDYDTYNKYLCQFDLPKQEISWDTKAMYDRSADMKTEYKYPKSMSKAEVLASSMSTSYTSNDSIYKLDSYEWRVHYSTNEMFWEDIDVFRVGNNFCFTNFKVVEEYDKLSNKIINQQWGGYWDITRELKYVQVFPDTNINFILDDNYEELTKYLFEWSQYAIDYDNWKYYIYTIDVFFDYLNKDKGFRSQIKYNRNIENDSDLLKWKAVDHGTLFKIFLKNHTDEYITHIYNLIKDKKIETLWKMWNELRIWLTKEEIDSNPHFMMLVKKLYAPDKSAWKKYTFSLEIYEKK